ncbi:hypothetical protein BC941DRAFT_472012 [Chlamydoabsidia padenii]|nr:hypothetical protein BC941DRAFT_472012 [Chlamydoabsidia padenii]
MAAPDFSNTLYPHSRKWLALYGVGIRNLTLFLVNVETFHNDTQVGSTGNTLTTKTSKQQESRNLVRMKKEENDLQLETLLLDTLVTTILDDYHNYGNKGDSTCTPLFHFISNGARLRDGDSDDTLSTLPCNQDDQKHLRGDPTFVLSNKVGHVSRNWIGWKLSRISWSPRMTIGKDLQG